MAQTGIGSVSERVKERNEEKSVLEILQGLPGGLFYPFRIIKVSCIEQIVESYFVPQQFQVLNYGKDNLFIVGLTIINIRVD